MESNDGREEGSRSPLEKLFRSIDVSPAGIHDNTPDEVVAHRPSLQSALEEVRKRFGEQPPVDLSQKIDALTFVQAKCQSMEILSSAEDLSPTSSPNGKVVHILPYAHPPTTKTWERYAPSYQLLARINAECYQLIFLLLQARCIKKMHVEQRQQELRAPSFEISVSGQVVDGFSSEMQGFLYLNPTHIAGILEENRGKFYQMMSGVEFLPAKSSETVSKSECFFRNNPKDLAMFANLQLVRSGTVQINRQQAEAFMTMAEQSRQLIESINNDFCNVAHASKAALSHMAMGSLHLEPVSDTLRNEGFRILTSHPATLSALPDPQIPHQTAIYHQIKDLIT